MLNNAEWYTRFYELALLPREQKVNAVTEELRRLSEPRNLRSMLDEFVLETAQAVHYHTDSYQHDNGFDKLVLFQDQETRMKLRLHIWYPMSGDNTRVRQNVHNHRWDFSSVVLLGEVSQRVYEFAKADELGTDFHHYRYFARGSKEHYEVEKLGTARLVCTESTRFRAGDLNCVDNEILHAVDIPDSLMSATLIITHENVGWVTNDLLSEQPLAEDLTRLPSPAMTKEVVLARVENLCEALGI